MQNKVIKAHHRHRSQCLQWSRMGRLGSNWGMGTLRVYHPYHPGLSWLLPIVASTYHGSPGFQGDWAYVKIEQVHHVDELGLICTTQDWLLSSSPVLFLCLPLRQSEHELALWWAPVQVQHGHLCPKPGRQGARVTQKWSFYPWRIFQLYCNKCCTDLHTGGKDKCPWNAMPKFRICRCGSSCNAQPSQGHLCPIPISN